MVRTPIGRMAVSLSMLVLAAPASSADPGCPPAGPSAEAVLREDPPIQDLAPVARTSRAGLRGALLRTLGFDAAAMSAPASGYTGWIQGAGDLDGDGAADVLHVETTGSSTWSTSPMRAEALRGVDGTPMWQRGTYDGRASISYVTGQRLDDVPGDDIIEYDLLWSQFPAPPALDLTIRGVSGSSGSVLWSRLYHNAVQDTPAGRVSLDFALPPARGELNGDGYPEILVVRYNRLIEQKIDVIVHEAVSGRTGLTTAVLSTTVQQEAPRLPVQAVTPDLTGDGLDDVVIAQAVPEGARVIARSGLTGAVAWERTLPADPRGLSWVRGAALDADGRGDVLVAITCVTEPLAETTLHALSGDDGSIRWSRSIPAGSAYVWEITPDVDGDGTADVMAMGLRANAGRWISLHSGATGAEFWMREFPGTWIQLVGDGDGDGVPDVLTIPCEVADGKCQAGLRHELVSGRDGSIVWTRPQPEEAVEMVRPLYGDLDGDGGTDYLLAETDAGDQTVYVPISGRDGEELWDSRRTFVSGPLFGRVIELRPGAPGSDLLESFFAGDHPQAFAARPGDGGAPLWTRPRN